MVIEKKITISDIANTLAFFAVLVIVMLYVVSKKPSDIIPKVDANTQQIELLQRSQDKTLSELRELNATLSRLLVAISVAIDEKTKGRYTIDDAAKDWREAESKTNGVVPLPERFKE